MRFEIAHVPAASEPIRQTRNYYLNGWFPTNLVDVSGICPEGVARIDESTTFANAAFLIFTLTIYSPRTSYFYCRLPAPAPVSP
jgi:hypothetical protein